MIGTQALPKFEEQYLPEMGAGISSSSDLGCEFPALLVTFEDHRLAKYVVGKVVVE